MPGHVVADEAIAWLDEHRAGSFFLWVHLFEPHAPYGDPSDHRPVGERYDDEVAEADRQVARLVEALGKESASTLIAVAGDHGEAFGEHGEISHSVFVYDTTLRVPLVIVGPGIAPSVVHGAVGLVDLAPTLLGQLGPIKFDSDGIDLRAALAGAEPAPRELYAESFAPLLDFGWSPLRAIRAGDLKYIAAPTPELYRVSVDAGERAEPRRERKDAGSIARRSRAADLAGDARDRQSAGSRGGGAAAGAGLYLRRRRTDSWRPTGSQGQTRARSANRAGDLRGARGSAHCSRRSNRSWRRTPRIRKLTCVSDMC